MVISQDILVRRTMLFCAMLLSGGNALFPREPLVVFVILMGGLFYGALGGRLHRDKTLAYLWLGFLVMMALAGVHRSGMAANLVRAINFFAGLVLLRLYWGAGRQHFIGDLRALLWPMAHQAWATVVLALLVPGLFFHVQYGGIQFQSFFGVLSYHVTVEGASRLVRPNGFFFEPGVFQFYLNLLLFVLFIQNAPWRKRFLAIGAVFLTQSTTGIAIAALQLAYFSIVPMLRSGVTSRGIISLAVIALLVPPVFMLAKSNIESKLTGSLAGSATARAYDLQAGLQVITDHPLVGIGFDHNVYLRETMRSGLGMSMLSEINQDGRATSNGLMMALYSVGIPLGLIYLLAFFFQKLLPHRLLLGVIVMLSLSTEALPFTPFFVLFAFSGLSLAGAARKRRGRPSQSPPAQPQVAAVPTPSGLSGS